jgi:3-deoxy-D-manno-octulosonic-acid transferase
MQLVYSVLLSLAFLLLLPGYLYKAIVKRRSAGGLGERFGFLPAEWRNDARPTILLHAVSVGEAVSAGPLLKALRKRFPGHRLIVSTTTETGQAVSRTQYAGVANAFCFFPFDWKFSVRRALDAIHPQVVILMESELWLNFLEECRARAIPVIVANGRISDRSFRRSQKAGFFVRRLYAGVSRFVMQSAVDAERAIGLGAPADRVIPGGNLKYDLGETGSGNAETIAMIDEIFALREKPLLIAGSTHEGEEEIVLEAFRRLRATPGLEDVRLLLSPRHPDRFEAVATAFDFPGGMCRRSVCVPREGAVANETPRLAGVVLLDSVGELAAIYQFATIVFVGGSLVPIGGHNILEPALYGKPIIVGPHMHNFRDITAEFLRRHALRQIDGENREALQDALYGEMRTLLTQPSLAQSLGESARRAIEENRGATARIVDVVQELM